MGKELHSPCDVLLASPRYKNAVATVVLQHRANVPAVNAVKGPGAAFLRCFMQENLGNRRDKRCYIKFEGSVEESF